MDGSKERRFHKARTLVYSQSKRRADALKAVHDAKVRRQQKYREEQMQSFSAASIEAWNTQEEQSLARLLQKSLTLSGFTTGDSPSEHQTELMQPNWMIEYPYDLVQNWLVMARPEGRRCLVEGSNGKTVSRTKNGNVLHTFESPIPGGSSKRDSYSLLDCIYHEDNRTYYIMDMLCWNDVWVTDCDALFRQHWVATKVQETLNIQAPSFKFEAVPVHDCRERGLLAGLYDQVPFVRDGICLMHKEGRYVTGPTELVLLWKDLTCSRYLIETDMDGNPTEEQAVNLLYEEDGQLYTGDSIAFTELLPCSFDIPPNLQSPPPQLMTFHLIQTEDGDMNEGMMHLECMYRIRNKKRKPDLLSKILFQRYARENRIHSRDLIKAVNQQSM